MTTIHNRSQLDVADVVLGFRTGYDQGGNLDRFGPDAWVNGGSPAEGFL